MVGFLPVVNKARKPKFVLHLTIYDLNNIPLGTGTSLIKWYLPHGMHGEHRGSTPKVPVDNTTHRVTYNYSKIIPLRITIDRNNHLSDCPIDFEVLQEFSSGGRAEKITLGTVKLNLAEYVEESENLPRRTTATASPGSLEYAREETEVPVTNGRRLSSTSTNGSEPSPTGSDPPAIDTTNAERRNVGDDAAEDGIVRRYLMQESKVNSTLKIGILMIQTEGGRTYTAPALKTAAMFGGIAGILGSEPVEPIDDSFAAAGTAPSGQSARFLDASEMQDMYRCTLAASWWSQAGELAADECIEDIFSGGTGWKETHPLAGNGHGRGRAATEDSASGASNDETPTIALRPGTRIRIKRKLQPKRKPSGSSMKSMLTVITSCQVQNGPLERPSSISPQHPPTPMRAAEYEQKRHSKQRSQEENPVHGVYDRLPQLSNHQRNQNNLVSPLGRGDGSDRSRGASYQPGFRRPTEVDESEVRDDLVSWALPGTAMT